MTDLVQLIWLKVIADVCLYIKILLCWTLGDNGDFQVVKSVVNH